MKQLLLMTILLCCASVALAHDGQPHQMTAQEMQINAVERWSRMVTHDQRQRAAKTLQQNAEKLRRP